MGYVLSCYNSSPLGKNLGPSTHLWSKAFASLEEAEHYVEEKNPGQSPGWLEHGAYHRIFYGKVLSYLIELPDPDKQKNEFKQIGVIEEHPFERAAVRWSQADSLKEKCWEESLLLQELEDNSSDLARVPSSFPVTFALRIAELWRDPVRQPRGWELLPVLSKVCGWKEEVEWPTDQVLIQAAWDVMRQTPGGLRMALLYWVTVQPLMWPADVIRFCNACAFQYNGELESLFWTEFLDLFYRKPKHFSSPKVLEPLRLIHYKGDTTALTEAFNHMIACGLLSPLLLALAVQPKRLYQLEEWLDFGHEPIWPCPANCGYPQSKAWGAALRMLLLEREEREEGKKRLAVLRQLSDYLELCTPPSSELIGELLMLEARYFTEQLGYQESPLVMDHGLEDPCLLARYCSQDPDWGNPPAILKLLGCQPDYCRTGHWPMGNGNGSSMYHNDWAAWDLADPTFTAMWRAGEGHCYLYPAGSPAVVSRLLAWAWDQRLSVRFLEQKLEAEPPTQATWVRTFSNEFRFEESLFPLTQGYPDFVVRLWGVLDSTQRTLLVELPRSLLGQLEQFYCTAPPDQKEMAAVAFLTAWQPLKDCGYRPGQEVVSLLS